MAALLEFLPGLFTTTFRIGHTYSANVVRGLLAMFGYWFVFAENVAMCFVLIDSLTMPARWLVMIVSSPAVTVTACRR